jgi:hypothetical protein
MALDELPAGHTSPLVLHWIHGLSFYTIAGTGARLGQLAEL